MRQLRIPALCAAVFVLACWGCRPDVQPPAASSPEEKHRQWLALADVPVENLDYSAAVMLGEQLAAEDRLDLIFTTLGDASANPKAKLLAVVSLTPLLRPEMTSQLAALTESAREATTRACAAKLLGFIDDDGARARLRELMHDPERRVRVSAMLMLARAHDASAVEALPTLWADPETNAAERVELVLSLPDEGSARFEGIYKDAALDHALDPEIRMRSVTALGEIGNPGAAAVLERCAAEDPVPAVREMARSAADAIAARTTNQAAGGAAGG